MKRGGATTVTHGRLTGAEYKRYLPALTVARSYSRLLTAASSCSPYGSPEATAQKVRGRRHTESRSAIPLPRESPLQEAHGRLCIGCGSVKKPWECVLHTHSHGWSISHLFVGGWSLRPSFPYYLASRRPSGSRFLRLVGPRPSRFLRCLSR